MSTLEPSTLRCSPPQKVAQHLRAVVEKASEDEITKQLIHFVDIGLVPPAVFAPWLCISPKSLHSALIQAISAEVRRLAIKKLRKDLRSWQWSLTWDSIGGVQGCVDLLSRFSAKEVKETCRAIGTSAKAIDGEVKREEVTQLFLALQPRFFPVTPQSSQDERTLSAQYRRLLPSCTKEFVTNVIDGDLKGKQGIPHDVCRRLLLLHSDALQAAALRYVFENHPSGKEWLWPLLHDYPSETAAPKGFSASMMFSFVILHRLLEEESPLLSAERCIHEIVQPLLKRAVKKKIDWSMKLQIVDVALKYLEAHPNVAKSLGYERNGLLHLVSMCWSRRPEMFETQFTVLLTYSHKSITKGFFVAFEHLLMGVPRSRRYAVLQFCYKNATGHDLNVEKGLKGAKCFLSSRLLHQLQAAEALGLFSRLRSAQGGEFVGRAGDWDFFLGSGSTPDSKTGDVDMWQTFLLRRAGHQEEAKKIAIKCMQARKQAAVSSSTPEQRAFYAGSVFNFAVACESLELYRQAHEWAQRFIRDSLVVKELYQNPNLDVRVLLAGIPESVDKGVTATDLRRRVKLVNQILSSLFDRACMALREPSFSVRSWHGTLCLFSHAVRHRIERSNEVKDALGLSEDELYDVLWKDTQILLTAVEQKALVPSHSRLHVDYLGGILAYGRRPIPLIDGLPSTYRFFDDLAKARDDIWRRYRPTVHPAAASLPDPFPRGLPLQHLCEPYTLDDASLETLAPYIASRRDLALFLDPSLAQRALPSDEETRRAIGVFVDDYSYAFSLLLPTRLGKEEKEARIDRAWTHAINALSQGRMSPGEAVRYWQTTRAYRGLPLGKTETERWPLLPTFDTSSHTIEVEEWNPIPDDIVESKSRTLDNLTYIDVSKRISEIANAKVHSTVEYSMPTIPGVERHEVWSTARIDQAKAFPDVREAQVLSSLLYLDTFSSTKTRILSKAFPSSSDHIRYPAVFLDGHFLSNMKLEKDAALSVLKFHRANVPAPLLAQITDNAMRTLDTTSVDADEYVETQRVAFRLVELLGHSDRPGLAADIAVRTIVGRPDASSWHRRLLSGGYFRRLPAQDAEACINSLADGIIAKLDEQAKAKKVRIETTDNTSSDPPVGDEPKDLAPWVKVTTVKFLAQLLSDTEFVSENFALSVLKKLIEKASHVDIRREVVSSLLSMLRTAPQTSVEQVLVALEAIVPIAGNIRERRPITDDEWTRIDETLELPELMASFSIRDEAPMLSSLLRFLRYPPLDQPTFPHSGAFVERIIMPIAEHLKTQTGKWVSVFLRKHGFDEAFQRELDIPLLPWHKTIMSELLISAPSHVPLSFLEDYVAYLRFNVEPSQPIASLIKKFNNDPFLRDTSSVQIFLTRFSAGPTIVKTDNNFPIIQLLHTPSQLVGSITTKTVQEQYLKLYTSVLWHDTDKLQNLRNMTGRLWAMMPDSEIPKSWAELQGPIIEAVVMYVEGLRTREWDRDAKRRPEYLPDTFQYRMWLLRYAAQHSPEAESGDHEAHCKKFADRVAKIADSLAGGIYHKKLQLLQDSLKYLHDKNPARVACYLGDISKTRLSWLTKPDLLRVELAAGLLKKKSGVKGLMDEDLEKRVEAMMESWRASENEEVRILGIGHE